MAKQVGDDVVSDVADNGGNPNNKISWHSEVRKISELKSYEKNPRKFTPKGMADLEVSLEKFGLAEPIVINLDNVICGGHARVKALQKISGKNAEVQVYVPSKLLDDAEIAELCVRLNKNIAGEFDFEILLNRFDMPDLLDWGFESAEFGIVEEQNIVGLTDPDEVPEVPEIAITRLGDTWLLGGHKIVCGDSTCKDTVALLCGDEKAKLMATDPPYLVNYSGGNHPQSWSNQGKANKDKHWDDYNEGEGAEFFSKFLSVALQVALTENPAIYQWHATKRQTLVEQAWLDNGLLVHQTLIWVKSRATLTRSHYMWQHEPCFYGWVKGNIPEGKPPSNMTTIWQIDSKIEDGASGIHPTQKPVETVIRPIEYHTQAGDMIYEPFSGSGTAIIAAETCKRRCYAMELSPVFVDVAVKRWQNFTGEQAIHQATGKSFNELEDEVRLI